MSPLSATCQTNHRPKIDVQLASCCGSTIPTGAASTWRPRSRTAETINEALGLLWIGCGTGDTLFNANKAFSEQLTAHGVEHTFRVTLGGHTPEVWSRYLHEVAPQLF